MGYGCLPEIGSHAVNLGCEWSWPQIFRSGFCRDHRRDLFRLIRVLGYIARQLQEVSGLWLIPDNSGLKLKFDRCPETLHGGIAPGSQLQEEIFKWDGAVIPLMILSNYHVSSFPGYSFGQSLHKGSSIGSRRRGRQASLQRLNPLWGRNPLFPQQ